MLPLWGLSHTTAEEVGHIPTPFPKPLCSSCPSRHALQRRCRKGIGTALLGEEGTRLGRWTEQGLACQGKHVCKGMREEEKWQ